MLSKPMDILHQFPVRKSEKEKQLFRDAVLSYAAKLDYEARVETGSKESKNVIIGDPDTAKYLLTAHYDTPRGHFLPNLMTPCNPVLRYLYPLASVLVLLLIGAAVFGILFLVGIEFTAALLIGDLVYMTLLVLSILGPANPNNANNNTSGVVTVLEIARTLPRNLRNRVCFVLFDMEECGFHGSKSHVKAHPAAAHQIVLNLDCVGDGNEILLIPTKMLRSDSAKMNALRAICGKIGRKSIQLHREGFASFHSDQKHFPYGVGIGAFHRRKGIGLYCSRIHTRQDTVLEETNVNILRAALTTLVSNDAAK